MIKILKVGEVTIEKLLERSYTEADVSGTVSEIIDDVKKRGDVALFDYCRRFDKAELSALSVSEEEFEEAMTVVSPRLIEILKTAAENIRKFHTAQVRQSFILNDKDGVVMGQKIIPLERVGLYVPGGTAAYPSTVLMDSIPALVAGCGEVVITTPPGRDGKINPAILAAARIAGVKKIFKVGGAQAVAALAYGTESIKKTALCAVFFMLFSPGSYPGSPA